MNSAMTVIEKLKNIEYELEGVGRLVCRTKGGYDAWVCIDTSLANIRKAMTKCYLMKDDDNG